MNNHVVTNGYLPWFVRIIEPGQEKVSGLTYRIPSGCVGVRDTMGCVWVLEDTVKAVVPRIVCSVLGGNVNPEWPDNWFTE